MVERHRKIGKVRGGLSGLGGAVRFQRSAQRERATLSLPPAPNACLIFRIRLSVSFPSFELTSVLKRWGLPVKALGPGGFSADEFNESCRKYIANRMDMSHSLFFKILKKVRFSSRSEWKLIVHAWTGGSTRRYLPGPHVEVLGGRPPQPVLVSGIGLISVSDHVLPREWPEAPVRRMRRLT